jgi:hypothetical protein
MLWRMLLVWIKVASRRASELARNKAFGKKVASSAPDLKGMGTREMVKPHVCHWMVERGWDGAEIHEV